MNKFLIKKIQLNNFKKHTNVTLAFVTGLNAIVGKNGTGKSSILEAIDYLFTGTLPDKKENIMRAGTNTGFVIMEFELAGKEGRLERHLDSSKVVLDYDGKTYKKATEVKQLWEQLLGIDPTIFKNVIVAHQGQITSLFSEDPSTRGRMFQKIFMTPDFQKLRDVIWKYIKQAPPLYPVENIVDLTTQLSAAETELVVLQKSISEMEQSALPVQSDTARRLVDTIKKYFSDLPVIQELTEKIQQLQQQKIELSTNLSTLEQTIAKVNVDNLKTLKSAAEKMDIVKNLTITEADVKEAENTLSRTVSALDKIDGDVVRLKVEYDSVAAKLERFKNDKSGVCPLCDQPIVNIEKHLAELSATCVNLKTQYEAVLNEKINLLPTKTKLSSELVKKQDELRNKNMLMSEIANLSAGTELLSKELYDLAIQKYYDKQKNIQTLSKQIQTVEIDLAVSNQKLSDLCKDKTTYTEKDLADAEEKYRSVEERYMLWVSKNMEVKGIERTISDLNNRIKQAKIVVEKNKKITEYSATLQNVYDGFHTQNFPNRLLENYTGVVGEYINEYLREFNAPFEIVIDDTFNVVAYDEYGTILPALSGGQKIIVGLCLRFSLHALFSQSFPLMIIDEGTTHLDVDNRQLYFSVLKNMIKTNGLNQVLVVDHDDGLNSVAEHLITLYAN